MCHPPRPRLTLPCRAPNLQVLSGRAAQLDATVRTMEQDLGFVSEELKGLQVSSKASARDAGKAGADTMQRLERALYGVQAVLMGSGPGGDLRGLMTPPPAGAHGARPRRAGRVALGPLPRFHAAVSRALRVGTCLAFLCRRRGG